MSKTSLSANLRLIDGWASAHMRDAADWCSYGQTLKIDKMDELE